MTCSPDRPLGLNDAQSERPSQVCDLNAADRREPQLERWRIPYVREIHDLVVCGSGKPR